MRRIIMKKSQALHEFAKRVPNVEKYFTDFSREKMGIQTSDKQYLEYRMQAILDAAKLKASSMGYSIEFTRG